MTRLRPWVSGRQSPWTRLARMSFLAGAVLGLLWNPLLAPAQSGRIVRVVEYEGAITPVAAEYLVGAIESAELSSAEAVVIELDTPGGLDTAMRDIVKAELAANVPVVVYVAPSGSRAASAGVFITMAAHVAAMAPSTNIGSASPVQMMGGAMDSTMSRKVTNDAVAYLEGIARQRGRNEGWAARFVVDADNIAADQAVEEGVVDFVAVDRADLLAQLHGREVELPIGPHTLYTAGATIEAVEMGLRHRILSIIADPTLAYLLLLLGIYGIFFELSNPGAILPGVVGAIAIVLALFALSALPVSLAGVGLIVLGVVFFILEVFVTSFGLLSIAGIVSLLLGSTMLFDSGADWAKLSWKVIAPAVAVSAAFFIVCVVLAIRGQRRPKATGKQALIGEEGRITVAIEGPGREGKIVVFGEVWPAVAAVPLAKGERGRVVELLERQVRVEPVESGP